MSEINLQAQIENVRGFFHKRAGKHYLCVVGSGATGGWDDLSDLDLFLVLPQSFLELDLALVEGLFKIEKAVEMNVNGNVRIGWATYGNLNGLKIDLNIFSQEGLRELFSDVLQRHRPSVVNQRIFAAFRGHRKVGGSLDMSEFFPRHLEYPDELRRSSIRAGLQALTQPQVFYKHLLRGDYLTFSSYLNAFFMRLVMMLYALNKIHTGRTKKAAEEIQFMPLKPENFIQRMNAMLTLPAQSSAAECEDLLAELMTLVNENVKF